MALAPLAGYVCLSRTALLNVSTSYCLTEGIGAGQILTDPVVVSGCCGAMTLVEGFEDVEAVPSGLSVQQFLRGRWGIAHIARSLCLCHGDWLGRLA